VLIIGLIVRAKAHVLAERCEPPLNKLASILIRTAVALFAAVRWREIAAVIGQNRNRFSGFSHRNKTVKTVGPGATRDPPS
jgi:hypothetical protein